MRLPKDRGSDVRTLNRGPGSERLLENATELLLLLLGLLLFPPPPQPCLGFTVCGCRQQQQQQPFNIFKDGLRSQENREAVITMYTTQLPSLASRSRTM